MLRTPLTPPTPPSPPRSPPILLRRYTGVRRRCLAPPLALATATPLDVDVVFDDSARTLRVPVPGRTPVPAQGPAEDVNMTLIWLGIRAARWAGAGGSGVADAATRQRSSSRANPARLIEIPPPDLRITDHLLQQLCRLRSLRCRVLFTSARVSRQRDTRTPHSPLHGLVHPLCRRAVPAPRPATGARGNPIYLESRLSGVAGTSSSSSAADAEPVGHGGDDDDTPPSLDVLQKMPDLFFEKELHDLTSAMVGAGG